MLARWGGVILLDPTRETTSDATEKHVSTIDLGAETFESTVKDNDIVFVDFWASWCGPCRQFAPVYEQASEDNPDLVFGSVNTEEERELSGAAGITSIPTLMAFKEGSLVFAQPGALPPAALTKLIDAVRGLDMDEVRAQSDAEADAEADADAKNA